MPDLFSACRFALYCFACRVLCKIRKSPVPSYILASPGLSILPLNSVCPLKLFSLSPACHTPQRYSARMLTSVRSSPLPDRAHQVHCYLPGNCREPLLLVWSYVAHTYAFPGSNNNFPSACQPFTYCLARWHLLPCPKAKNNAVDVGF